MEWDLSKELEFTKACSGGDRSGGSENACEPVVGNESMRLNHVDGRCGPGARLGLFRRWMTR